MIKWKLSTGKQLDRKKFGLSLGGRRVNRKKLVRSLNDWLRTYDHKTITELRFTENPFATMYLMYNYKVDRLGACWVDCKKPINKLSWYVGRCGSLTPYITYRWGTSAQRDWILQCLHRYDICAPVPDGPTRSQRPQFARFQPPPTLTSDAAERSQVRFLGCLWRP